MTTINHFARSRAMAAAVATAFQIFAHNTTELIPRLREIQASSLYKSRGKGGKGRKRGKMLSWNRTSNKTPHQGAREIARRARGCHPDPIPLCRWYADPFRDAGFKSKNDLVHSVAYKATHVYSRTPAYLV
jgi:hypothetical protein